MLSRMRLSQTFASVPVDPFLPILVKALGSILHVYVVLFEGDRSRNSSRYDEESPKREYMHEVQGCVL